jgi:hypothetical protein
MSRMPKVELPSVDSGGIGKILFILAPPRSFSWKFCAALGQHPQMYGLPEMHLLPAQTVGEWWNLCATATYSMSDGVLRAVAQIVFGQQSESAVKSASGWLRRRSHFATGMVFEVLAEHSGGRILIDKSPSTVYSIAWMQRAFRMFPEARFLHLVRHPKAHCASVAEAMKELRSAGPVPERHWLFELADFRNALPSERTALGSAEPNPQRGWFALNCNICDFLDTISPEQHMRVQAEEYIAAPEKTLKGIIQWMGLSTNVESLAAMRHPERSPFARPGPINARFGHDGLYLNTPSLSAPPANGRGAKARLANESSEWVLRPEVAELARTFGYSGC